MINNIRNINIELANGNCEVNADELHEQLLRLPAEVYIRLYHLMVDRVENINLRYIFPEEDGFDYGDSG